MTTSVDFAIALLIIMNFLLLGSSRLRTCIKVGALQGILVGLLPVLGHEGVLSARVAGLGLIIILLKGLVFPHLLLKAIRETSASREIKPVVGYMASLFAGIFFAGASFWLSERLEFPSDVNSLLVVPVAFFMIITGLFLIVARRTAINQVLGYIVMENGIYSFALAVARDVPVLVELGVLMDTLVAVFVMGIAVYRINREFDHIDSDQLTTLKG